MVASSRPIAATGPPGAPAACDLNMALEQLRWERGGSDAFHFLHDGRTIVAVLYSADQGIVGTVDGEPVVAQPGWCVSFWRMPSEHRPLTGVRPLSDQDSEHERTEIVIEALRVITELVESHFEGSSPRYIPQGPDAA